MFESQQRIRVPRTELKHELSCKNLLIKDETRNILASLLLGRSLNRNRNQRFSEYAGGGAPQFSGPFILLFAKILKTKVKKKKQTKRGSFFLSKIMVRNTSPLWCALHKTTTFYVAPTLSLACNFPFFK